MTDLIQEIEKAMKRVLLMRTILNTLIKLNQTNTENTSIMFTVKQHAKQYKKLKGLKVYDYSKITNERIRNELMRKQAIEQWLVIGFFVAIISLCIFVNFK